MALSRTLRLVALLSIVLFLYLFFQIFRPPALLSPDGDKLEEVTRDPNLDCTTRLNILNAENKC